MFGVCALLAALLYTFFSLQVRAAADSYQSVKIRDMSSPAGVDFCLSEIAEGRRLLVYFWIPGNAVCDQEVEMVSDFNRQLRARGVHAVMAASIPPTTGGEAAKNAAWRLIRARALTLPPYLDYGQKLKLAVLRQSAGRDVKDYGSSAVALFTATGALERIRTDFSTSLIDWLSYILPEVGRKREMRLAEPSQLPKDCTDHRHRRHIARALAAGVMSAYPDGTFRPAQPVAQEHFVVALARAGGRPKQTLDKNAGAGGEISRARALTVVVSALLSEGRRPEGGPELGDFVDAGQIPKWARETYEDAYGLGLLEMGPQCALRPNAPTTRGDAAFWLTRLLKPKPEQYTGLVIDASARCIYRGPMAAIYDPQGRRIYPLDGATPTLTEAPPSYPRTAWVQSEQAGQSSRAGSNPLVIVPVDVADRSGNGDRSVVVSDEDADRITSANLRSGLLDDWLVCFSLGVRVLATDPADAAVSISREPKLRVRFSKPVDERGLKPGVVTLRAMSGEVIPVSVEAIEGGRACIITPEQRLAPGAGYEVTLSRGGPDVNGSALRDRCGEEVGGEGKTLASWHFTTESSYYVSLNMTGYPQGSSVFIDNSNRPAGHLPLRATGLVLQSGEHVLRIEKAGYSPGRVAIRASADGTLKLPEVRLKPLLAALRLRPSEAESELGKPVEVTVEAVDADGRSVGQDLRLMVALASGRAEIQPSGTLDLSSGSASVTVRGAEPGTVEVRFTLADDPTFTLASFLCRFTAPGPTLTRGILPPTGPRTGETQWAPIELHRVVDDLGRHPESIHVRLGLTPWVAVEEQDQIGVVSQDRLHRYARVPRLPAQYEYVVGADGHLEFSPAAAGELVEISYRYHPKRVGIWLTGPVTDPHVTRGVDTLLATLLQERGIEPVAAYVTNTSSSEIEKALREIDGDALLVISMSKVEGDEVAAKLAAYRPVAVGGEIARWTSDREQRFRAPEGGSAGDRRVVSLDRLRTGLENLLEPWFAQLGLTRPPSLLRTGEHQAP